MRASRAYKDWIRRSYLNKFDIRLLEQIAQHKAGFIKTFHYSETKKNRLEKIKVKVKDVVKKDIYPFKEELSEEENFKLNDAVAGIIDFTDVI